MEAREICEAIDDIAKTEDIALLSSMGIDVELSESDFDSDTSNFEPSPILDLPDVSALVPVLEDARYNWFQVLDYVGKKLGYVLTESLHVMEYLKKSYVEILSKLDDAEKAALLQQSYFASLALL